MIGARCLLIALLFLVFKYGDPDLVLKIYNSQGTLLSTINDPLILNAGISLSASSFYVSASTTDNQFTTRYECQANIRSA
jgi:hypothetical protein